MDIWNNPPQLCLGRNLVFNNGCLQHPVIALTFQLVYMEQTGKNPG